MQKITSFVLVGILAMFSLFPGLVEAKVEKKTAKTTTKTSAVAKTAKKPAVKKPAAKPATKAAAGAIVSVAAAAETVPVNTCMQAIAKANTFCKKVAKGCPSWSTTEKCVAANEQCEAQQNEALALCPTI